MKRSFILAAIVAFATASITASVPAKAYNLSADELAICEILELAHESSCSEFEMSLARQSAEAQTDEQTNTDASAA